MVTEAFVLFERHEFINGYMKATMFVVQSDAKSGLQGKFGRDREKVIFP